MADTTGETKEIVSVLNDLIAISKDGIEGFQTAAGAVKNAEAKAFLQSRVRTIEAGKAELEGTVRRLGAEPAEHGHAVAAAHRAWIELKAAVTGKNEEAILREVVRGEEAAVEHYRNALKKPLPPDVRAMVERELRGVEENLARARSLPATVRSGTPSSTTSATQPRRSDLRPDV